MNVLETVKDHPYAIGGGLAALVVLYFVLHRGSSTVASSTAATAPADNSLAIAQIQAGQSAMSVAAQLDARKDDNATQVYIASLAQSIQLAGINAQEQTQSFGIAKAADVALAQIEGQTNIAQ